VIASYRVIFLSVDDVIETGSGKLDGGEMFIRPVNVGFDTRRDDIRDRDCF